MSVDYFVAVHAADWPTPAALNRCLTEFHYPIQITAVPEEKKYQPIDIVPNTLGLVVLLDGQRVELEASVTRLGPSSPYAYRLRRDLPKQETTGPNGTEVTVAEMTPNAFVPSDINADLQKLGKMMPFFKNGDYVLTISYGSSKSEHIADDFILAGLIRCANGFGFEFQGPSFGKASFADDLVADANQVRNSK